MSDVLYYVGGTVGVLALIAVLIGPRTWRMFWLDLKRRRRLREWEQNLDRIERERRGQP